MKTKQEFQAQIAAAISNYPLAAQLYQARDPRLLAQLDAMATMLAMASAEQDVAAMEPWTKARDMTVLADAAVKGILPFGRPLRARIRIENATGTPFSVVPGRVVLDTQGRRYVTEVGATIPANGYANIEAVQKAESAFTATVSVSQPFYRIAVPKPAVGYLAEIRLKDAANIAFAYAPEFTNVLPDDKVFNLESDELRDLYIVLGATDIAGYQPSAGEVFSVTIIATEGDIDVPAGSKFAFEYSGSLYENGATLTLDAVLIAGDDPMDIATMREVTGYPSTYDDSAVYLGNFDFLIRRKLSPFRFLSVWNEQVEEAARGYDVDNINRLFVAAEKTGVLPATLESQIMQVINAADDSYRITFVAVDNQTITVAITATISPVYDAAAVESQIEAIVLANYGENSAWAKRGRGRIQYKKLYDLLENGVQALQDAVSDMEIEITDPPASIMPEQFRYVDSASLSITVTTA